MMAARAPDTVKVFARFRPLNAADATVTAAGQTAALAGECVVFPVPNVVEVCMQKEKDRPGQRPFCSAHLCGDGRGHHRVASMEAGWVCSRLEGSWYKVNLSEPIWMRMKLKKNIIARKCVEHNLSRV